MTIDQSSNTNPDSIFEVYRIDSINNFYLIYAKKADSIYKIVSSKKANMNCDNVKLHHKYYLPLQPIWTKPIMLGNVNVSPSQTPHVTGLYFDDSTIIKIDRSNGIYNLYNCENIQGLCYLKYK